MASTTASRFDIAINCVILLTCGVIVAAVLERRGTIGSPSRPPGIHQFRVDQTADSLPGVAYDAAPVTFVLYLKSTCPYCTHSMAFYRRLSALAASRKAAQLVAISGESLDVLRNYLDANQLRTDASISSKLHLQPTPTLLLVDNKGSIKRIWDGQQDPAGEREILKYVNAQ